MASRSTAAWRSSTSKATLRSPSSLAIAAGDPDRKEGPVLPDPAAQPVAVHGEPVDGGLEVVNLESDVAQPQLVGHRGRRPGLVVGPDETGKFQPGASVGRPQHDNLGAGVRDADDS